MVDTLHSLLAKFKGVPERLETSLSMAVSMAASMVAGEAKQVHGYKDRSGTLTNSIAPDPGGPQGTFAGNNLHSIVSAGAGYSLYIERGTKAHVIKPKHRRSLRFATPYGFRFARAVHHPGTKPYRFLANAVDVILPKLSQELVPDAIELAFAQAGFTRG